MEGQWLVRRKEGLGRIERMDKGENGTCACRVRAAVQSD
jgi:hypothetical protein